MAMVHWTPACAEVPSFLLSKLDVSPDRVLMFGRCLLRCRRQFFRGAKTTHQDSGSRDSFSLPFKDEWHNGLEQQDAEWKIAAKRP